jgi:hypothetical protein
MTAPETSNTAVMAKTIGGTISNSHCVSNQSCQHVMGVFDDYLKHCHESCSRYSDWDRLLFACQQNKREIVRHLIEEGGVDPSYCNPMKQSALHIAAGYGHVECLEYVLQRIPHENRIHVVNSKNRLSGATPLHCCLQKNASGKKERNQESISRRMASVRLLIQAGANLEVQDATGKTPLDYWESNFECSPWDDDLTSHVLLAEELHSKVTV